jgi:hypothetical protein
MPDIPIESQRAVVHLVRTWWGDSYGHNMAEAMNDDVVREDFADTYPRLVEAGFVYGPEAEKEARIDEASRCAIHETEAARAALLALRGRVEGLLDGILRLRLTGAQMADLPEDGTNVEDFFVDFDEYEDWLPESVLRAAVLAEINRALEATNG